MNSLQKTSVHEDPAIRYLVLKNSLKLFEEPHHRLETVEQLRAEKDALAEYRIQRLILQSDEALMVSLPDSLVNRALAVIRNRYAAYDAYAADLRENGLTEAGFRTAVANELKAEAVLEMVANQAPPLPEHRPRRFYEKHAAHFRVPETRTARHILITINPKFPENRRPAALKRIAHIERAVRQDPLRFAEQARLHSECPSALDDGRLGRLPRNRLSPALAAALFALREKESSTIVESDLGFHLLFCETIHPARPLAFDEAAPLIRARLEATRRQRFKKQWLTRLLAGTGPASS